MRITRNRRGQVRVIEAVLGAILIFSSFMMASYLSRPSRIWLVKERSELEGQGFNILHMLVESGTLEGFLSARTEGWEKRFSVLLQTLLPPNVYYNLTIYSVSLNISSAQLTEINQHPITNMVSSDQFPNTLEIISETYPYTSKDRLTYMFVLTMSVGGPGG